MPQNQDGRSSIPLHRPNASDFPSLSVASGVAPPLSFSSIAGGTTSLRNERKEAEFTIDDFPALTLAGPQSSSPAISSTTGLRNNTQSIGIGSSGTLTNSIRNEKQQQQQQQSQQPQAALSHQQQQQMDSQSQAFGSILGGIQRGNQSVNGGEGFGMGPLLSTKLRPSGQNYGPAPTSGGIPTGLSGNAPLLPPPNYAAKASSDAPPHSLPAGGDKYGLYGLLDVIRMTDPDVNMLSLGTDLTSLGLNLNDNGPLYATFVSPFSNTPTAGVEPQFNLPPCYSLTTPPPPALTRIPSFSDETLFYIFYAMPREAIQEAAAQELYNRNWRYHKELRLWLTKEPGSEAIVKGAGFERGIYLFFDPSQWARVKKEWVLYYDQLEERAPVSPQGNRPMDSPTNSIGMGSLALGGTSSGERSGRFVSTTGNNGGQLAVGNSLDGNTNTQQQQQAPSQQQRQQQFGGSGLFQNSNTIAPGSLNNSNNVSGIGGNNPNFVSTNNGGAGTPTSTTTSSMWGNTGGSVGSNGIQSGGLFGNLNGTSLGQSPSTSQLQQQSGMSVGISR